MPKALAVLRARTEPLLEHPRFVTACLLLGIVLRLIWIALVDAEQVSDFGYYYQLATNLASGKGYSLNGIPTGYWPIGYPAFLSALFYLTGPVALVGKLANVLLSTGVIYVTYLLSKRWFQSELAARVALCILCFLPNHIAYSSLLSSEILFIFLVALGVLLLDAAENRTNQLLLCGLVWGLATLTKPQAIVLPIIILFTLSNSRKAFVKSGLIIYGLVILLAAPWAARNYYVMGAAALSNTGGINLLDGNNPYATGSHNYSEDVNELLGDLRMTPSDYPLDAKEAPRDARAREIAVDYILHNPGRTLALLPRKFIVLFLSDTEGVYYSLGMMAAGDDRPVVLAARALAELYYGFVLVLFLVSLPAILKPAIRAQLTGLAIVSFLIVLYLALFGNARYHFPMMPWLAIYAGIGAQRLLCSREGELV